MTFGREMVAFPFTSQPKHCSFSSHVSHIHNFFDKPCSKKHSSFLNHIILKSTGLCIYIFFLFERVHNEVDSKRCFAFFCCPDARLSVLLFIWRWQFAGFETSIKPLRYYCGICTRKHWIQFSSWCFSSSLWTRLPLWVLIASCR